MAKNLKKEILNGTIWSIAGQFASLAIVFIANILFSRILTTHEFGQVGIVMFFITIISVLSESGLGGALVRNKNASMLDYSTALVTNIILSFILFVIILIIAKPIAIYYNDSNLTLLLIVSSISVLINAFQISQHAKLVSNLQFKKVYIYRFFSTLLAAIIGIVMLLFFSFGVWSLVSFQLLISLFYTLALWIFEKSEFSLKFSKESFNRMGSFGINTTLSSLINSFFDNVYQLILGKYFSIELTGNFYQAKKLQDVPVNIFSVLFQGIIFSSLSKFQDNKVDFFKVYSQINRYFTVIISLLFLLIFLFSKTIILILYSNKWIDSSYFLQILSLVSFFYLKENLLRVIIKIFDKTKYLLLLDIIKKIVQSISVVIAIYYNNISYLLLGFAFSSFVGYIIYYYVANNIMRGNVISEISLMVKISLIAGVIYFINNLLLETVFTSKFITLLIDLFLFMILVFVLKLIKINDVKIILIKKRLHE